jgi:hypothetical protein
MNLHVETHGRFPRLTGVRTVVLHDRRGRIHHVHQALLFAGPALIPSLSGLEAIARRAANRRASLPPDLLVLHLEGPFPGHAPHRVDVARGVLVPESRRRAPLTRRPARRRRK